MECRMSVQPLGVSIIQTDYFGNHLILYVRQVKAPSSRKTKGIKIVALENKG